ncbi:MAG: transglutaminase-like domain-containing protein [Planctomycetota bacterium]
MAIDRVMTMLMLGLAGAAAEIASDDSRPVGNSLSISAAWTAGAILLAFMMPNAMNPRSRPPVIPIVLSIAFSMIPVVSEPFIRQQTGFGNPLELLMVRFLRCLGLGLAAAAAWRPCQHAAVICGLFLILFAAAMSDHRGVLVLVACHATVGGIWLMNEYRISQAGAAIPHGMPAVVERLPGDLRGPWARLVGVVVIAAIVAGTAVWIPPRGGWRLGEWIATSGGTGEQDPYARGGNGNGDDETEGDNPESTGMTRSDIFLDSPLPTLYDMISDMFGEPFKVKDQERVEALDPSQVKARETGKTPADNLRPNRSFPHGRNKGKPRPGAADRAARALFEVSGHGPLHVRAAAYDLFDGDAWREGAPVRASIIPVTRDTALKRFVMAAARPDADNHFPARHEIRITHPSGSLIPTPPHMSSFRLGRLSDPSFFAWAQPGILVFASRKTPSGIILDAESLVPVAARYESFKLTPYLPEGGHPEWRRPYLRIADEWTAGATGWSAVRAIVDRLRNDYRLDRSPGPGAAMAGQSLLDFLVERKAGDSHMFAGAAAALVECAGYQTRMVTGFYADDAKKDPETGTVPVSSADLHAWAEVRTSAGEWLILEATPGYRLPEPMPGWGEILLGWLATLAGFVRDRPLGFALPTALGLGLLAFRARISDAISHAALLMTDPAEARTLVVRALRLIESRARRCGSPRPAQSTFSAWLVRSSDSPAVAELACVSDWALYSDDPSPPMKTSEIRQLCVGCLRFWSGGAWHWLGWRTRQHGR